jgi:hypothetical protein
VADAEIDPAVLRQGKGRHPLLWLTLKLDGVGASASQSENGTPRGLNARVAQARLWPWV